MKMEIKRNKIACINELTKIPMARQNRCFTALLLTFFANGQAVHPICFYVPSVLSTNKRIKRIAAKVFTLQLRASTLITRLIYLTVMCQCKKNHQQMAHLVLSTHESTLKNQKSHFSSTHGQTNQQ